MDGMIAPDRSQKERHGPSTPPSGARKKALEYARWEVLEGERTWREAAVDLGTAPRTLRRWRRLEEGRGLAPKKAGRPRKLAGVLRRREVLGLLRRTGPSIGVEPLRERFEGLARSEAREILGKYREHYQRTHPRVLNELRWVVPGAVWAMDHTEGPRGEEVLAVRDLALGRKVLWKEVADLGAEELVRVLEPVLERERPLVLKVDRGSAFRSKALEAFLEEREVVILFSPPRRPEYNGSIESQIRWMKPLTRDVSERWGGARGEWTPEAFEMARTMANELRGRVHEAQSGILSEGFRAAFRETLAAELAVSEREALYEGAVQERIMHTLRRLAIERALVAHGILEVRRRLIPLPKRFLFAA